MLSAPQTIFFEWKFPIAFHLGNGFSFSLFTIARSLEFNELKKV